VVYNLKTGSVESGGEGGGRVKMRILPRNAQATPAAAETPPEDKGGN
jgi:lipopolysaccharide export system protein LptA